MKPIVLIQSMDAEAEFLDAAKLEKRSLQAFDGPQPILQGRVPGPSRPRAGSHRDLRHFLSQSGGGFEILQWLSLPLIPVQSP